MLKSDPYWWEDAGTPIYLHGLPLPTAVDVLVIGAGLTGLSAARTLAKNGKSVLVLDAAVPGAQASGRNGGMIGGGHRLSIDALEARFGKDVALRLLREAHQDSGTFFKKLMQDEKIDCDFTECGRFRGLWRDAEYEASARQLECLQSLVPIEAHMVPRSRQHEEVATNLYRGGVVYPRHGALNPAKWVAGILQAALRAGAQVQGNTPVLSVTRCNAGYDVRTNCGNVQAGQVLAATNGYTQPMLPRLKRRIIPVPSFMIVTEELGTKRLRELFPNGRMVAESRDRHCYYRSSPDGKRLVFGGRAAMFNAPEVLVQHEMRGLLEQVFPQLKGVGLTHSWRGNTGFSFNFLPNIGQIDGLWHALAYSGSGNAMAPWLGHKAALQILGDPEGETAFTQTDLPTRWWLLGSAWFLPFADVTFRIKDVWNNVRRKA